MSGAAASGDDLRALLAESELDQGEREAIISSIVSGVLPADLPAELLSEDPELAPTDIRGLIDAMPMSQKIKLALFGGAGARQILIFDSNRLVQTLVLKNPRINEAEIEALAQNKNASEYVLRGISDNKNWTRHYNIKRNLAANPKTPTDLSLKWLKHLHAHDLKRLSKSRELAQVVASSARRRLTEID